MEKILKISPVPASISDAIAKISDTKLTSNLLILSSVGALYSEQNFQNTRKNCYSCTTPLPVKTRIQKSSISCSNILCSTVITPSAGVLFLHAGRFPAIEGVDGAIEDACQSGQLVRTGICRPMHPFRDAGRGDSHGIGQLDTLESSLLHQFSDPHSFPSPHFGTCSLLFDVV